MELNLRELQSKPWHRTLYFDRAKIDTESRTVEVAFASAAPYERWWGVEVLDCTPESFRLDRLHAAGAVLVNHDSDQFVGRVVEARIDPDNVGRAVLRFGQSKFATEIWQDVLDGIRTSVSFGYLVHKMTLVEEVDGCPKYLCSDVEPFEISFVSIPADITVGVGRSADGPPVTHAAPAAIPIEVEIMETLTPDRQAQILELGKLADNLPLARELALSDCTVDEARQRLREDLNARNATLPRAEPLVLTPNEDRQFSLLRAIRLAADGTLDGFEREVSDEIAKRYGKQPRDGAFFMPSNLRVNRGLGLLGLQGFNRYGAPLQVRSLSTASGEGAATVFTEAGDFIDILRNRTLVIQMGAQFLGGLSSPVGLPKQTAASTASWVTESPASPVGDSQIAFGQVSLTPKTLQASTAYTRQLVVQSSLDVENLVRNDLALQHAIAIDRAAINGTGTSGEPRGILNTSGIGAVAIGTNGGAPTNDTVIDLETAVGDANADIGTMGYLTTPVIKGRLKKTQQFSSTNGMPIWMGSEVNGYRAEASKNVPRGLQKGTSTDCHAIIFGVFETLLIGEFGAVEVITDPYSRKKFGEIEVTTFQLVDVALRYPEAFAACVDARNV